MISLLTFLPRVLFSKGNPLQLIFFITSKCNLKCKHCFYKKNLNSTKNELDIKEIEKISQHTGRLLWFSITGGEPFLREDITQIAEVFYRNNKFKILTICTNGLLCEMIIKAVSEICKKCPKAQVIVYVSVDGLAVTHNRIRGDADGFEKTIKTIRELKKLKKHFKNFNVATVTTCSQENQTEMKDLALFIKNEIKPDNMTINLVREKKQNNISEKINLKYYFDFIEVQEKAWREKELNYFKFFGSSLLKRKEYLQKRVLAAVVKKNKWVLPCLAGNISCVMDEIGDLYPCEILDEKIGSLKDANYNFKRLWHSARANEIRALIKNTKCYCTYECAITTNILFSFKGIKNMIGRKIDRDL